MKAESDRARERMTLKHGSHNKFAKGLKASGLAATNTDARKAMQEQMSLAAQLKKKMNSVNDEDDDSEYEDDAVDEENEAAVKSKANVQHTENDEKWGEVSEDVEDEGPQWPKKGLFASLIVSKKKVVLILYRVL